VIDICQCGFPKSKHLNLEELNGIKNVPAVEKIVHEILLEYVKDMDILGMSPCLIYRTDNLKALEIEVSNREKANG
jgi:hypothetical protein